ncbi:MAG TPA: 2-oxoacid:acceptor oxidoreductase subunit alpha [Nitriliruptorales bacterium]
MSTTTTTTTTTTDRSEKAGLSREQRSSVVVRFAGDSGDGMQLTGDRFTQQSAVAGNDLATLPDFPAEIRAPAGTLPGVSSFQLHFSDHEIHTPGDQPDVLIAMNPAALVKNVVDVVRGGTIIVNTDGFTRGNLKKANLQTDPLQDGTVAGFKVHEVAITDLTTRSVEDLIEAKEITKQEAQRAKNMFALGLVSWMFGRDIDPTVAWLEKKFKAVPAVAAANVRALKAGYYYGETAEVFQHVYEVKPAKLPPGRYRNVTGNQALAYGIIAAGVQSHLDVFYGSYPITPASDVLHELSKQKHFGVRTFQAEDEIAAMGSVLGAAFGGALAVTASSGPGIALKTEAMGLAVAVELPLLVINVQRGGPSTGLPTKTEQADLLQMLFGRNGESPIPIVAAQSPSDCFFAAIEAARIALEYRTPVVLMSDGYLANSAEPWLLPDVAALPDISVPFAEARSEGDGAFLAFERDPDTLARPWAIPGTEGLQHRIGGLEKDAISGNISYDAANHQRMTELRAAKIAGIDVPDLEVEGDQGARLLVLGWGSTYGPIRGAVKRLREEGRQVARAHLRHLNPFPANLGDVLDRFDTVLVPENNMGQLSMLLRARFLKDVKGYNRVTGLPFGAGELADVIADHLDAADGKDTP